MASAASQPRRLAACLLPGRDRGVRERAARVERFPEFAPQGLQVVGADEVTTRVWRLVLRELFERAAALGAELVLVRTGSSGGTSRSSSTRGCAAGWRRSSAATRPSSPTTLRSTPMPSSATAQLAARIGAAPGAPFESVGLGCTIGPVSLDELAARVERLSSARRSSSAGERATSGGSPSRAAARATTSSVPHTRDTTRS